MLKGKDSKGKSEGDPPIEAQGSELAPLLSKLLFKIRCG